MTLYCPICDQDREVVSIRMDIFGPAAKTTAKRVYHCPEGHEIIEAVR